MPIRAELRVTARGLKLLSKLSAGPTRARAVAQTAINSTLKRSKPKAVRAVRAQVALPRNGESVFGVSDALRDALWRKARKRAEIVGLTFHDLRHEATTRLARKLDVLDLSRMTGHRDLKSLRRYYNPAAEEIADRLG